MLRLWGLLGCLLATGCAALPTREQQATLHNPFPQLSRIGVATFFNQSDQPTLDGHKVAEAYAAELAEVPGYEVISVPVVDSVARAYQIDLRSEADARRLAQILDVDAIVIGTVTDYWPWYPPRLTFKVAWYAANPNFHPIPAGYGLPWGTCGEKDIPGPLVFQAEMELAKKQLETQTPAYQKSLPLPPPDPQPSNSSNKSNGSAPQSGKPMVAAAAKGGAATSSATKPSSGASRHSPVETAAYQENAPAAVKPAVPARGISAGGSPPPAAGFPPDWPDPHGFIPRPPSPVRPQGVPCDEPVMQFTKSYRGNDVAFTTALEDYYQTCDDARLGNWQNYLYRSDDFIRFCCRLHIWEMLSARGGAGESRVVWRWSLFR